MSFLFNHRLGALVQKELRQIRRDRRLMMSLIVPPTLQILLFGFALNSTVSNLRMGIVDESHSVESRQLVSALTENPAFRISGYYQTPDELGSQLSRSKLDLGVVIPADFARQRVRGTDAPVQLLLDAVNANTAQIAQGYAEGAIGWFNQQSATPHNGTGMARSRAVVTTRVALLYNPGLENSWFIVTGIFGLLLVLNGSLVSAATMIKEKESGTVEQLLMTPADSLEIIIAKIAPLFLLLMGTTALVLVMSRLVFHVPLRGSMTLLLFSAGLCVLAGIGIGTIIATFTKSATQAQLMSFFVNPPMSMLSGATTPIEAMPKWLQPFTLLNPIRHFATIARGVMVKGAGIEVLYPNLLALAVFTFVLVGISGWRFRKQLD